MIKPMGQSELRKVNEVNGWKVNHPHSAANVLYAIYTLVYAAFPVLILYLALIANDPMLNGVDLFRFFIDFLKGAFQGNLTPTPQNLVILGVVSMVRPELQAAVYYMFVALGGIVLLYLYFSAIKLILAVVHLGKGYLRKSGAVKVIAIIEFVFTLLFVGAFVFFYFAFKENTGLDLVIWYSLIPLGVSLFFTIFFSVVHHIHFADTILESDLEVHNNEPVVEHVSKVHEVRKVKYEQSSTLPPNLTSIGGHAFAENQNLIVANIPMEVTKLGAGAFANCLNLQVVSIPASVKDIGFNCFFNCVELERINYAGTKSEWKKVRRGSNWLAKAKTTEVACLDGTIVVNPYH